MATGPVLKTRTPPTQQREAKVKQKQEVTSEVRASPGSPEGSCQSGSRWVRSRRSTDPGSGSDGVSGPEAARWTGERETGQKPEPEPHNLFIFLYLTTKVPLRLKTSFSKESWSRGRKN